MPTIENILSSIGSLFSWYAANAALIFAALILTAIFGEKVVQRMRHKTIDVRSMLTSWLSGAGFLVAKTIEKLIFVGLAFYIYENFRLFDLPMGNPLIWIGVLFVRDFIYYWVHRTEHTVRFFWASHLIHHSPQNIDMSSAVRIPWMEAIYKPWFSLWMPLLGVHPLVKIALDVFVSTIQQLHHTKAFPGRGDGTYPLIGRIFVTPSTHRVHHGYNPEYIDKNFGAVFIFWDKLFGTYAPEMAPVQFGVGEVDAVESPTDAFVGGYKRLWDNMRDAESPQAALAIAAGAPNAQDVAMEQRVWSQLMLVVSDVPASSAFYCELLGFESGHGGDEYEQLTHAGEIVLQLHHDGPDDDHGALVAEGPRGNGVLAWFEVADFDGAAARAAAMEVVVERSPHINPNAKQSELWLRDPDGYLIVIAGPSEYRPRSN